MRILGKQCNGRGHFQKAVTEKLETFIIFSHTALEMDLLVSMFLGVVGVLGQGLQSVCQLDFELQAFASILGNEIRLESGDNRRERKTGGCNRCRYLEL